ncbi:hypothetical protein Q427_18505 [Halomonas sp. BC04]|nr:hypothetical protein Q427_18505 [Halomonas sp. BC04]
MLAREVSSVTIDMLILMVSIILLLWVLLMMEGWRKANLWLFGLTL